MTWRIVLVSSLVLVAVCPARAQSDGYRLRWKNGDELAGQIVSAGADKLVWNSAVLARDVTLDISCLDSISRLSDDEAATEPSGSAFRVILAEGSILVGDLKDITPTHVVLENDRMGEVTVDRRWFDTLSVRKLPPGSVIEFIDLVGSRGDGWRSIDHRWEFKDRPLQDWDVSEPGRVATWSAGARLYLPTELPSS